MVDGAVVGGGIDVLVEVVEVGVFVEVVVLVEVEVLVLVEVELGELPNGEVVVAVDDGC